MEELNVVTLGLEALPSNSISSNVCNQKRVVATGDAPGMSAVEDIHDKGLLLRQQLADLLRSQQWESRL